MEANEADMLKGFKFEFEFALQFELEFELEFELQLDDVAKALLVLDEVSALLDWWLRWFRWW